MKRLLFVILVLALVVIGLSGLFGVASAAPARLAPPTPTCVPEKCTNDVPSATPTPTCVPQACNNDVPTATPTLACMPRPIDPPIGDSKAQPRVPLTGKVRPMPVLTQSADPDQLVNLIVALVIIIVILAVVVIYLLFGKVDGAIQLLKSFTNSPESALVHDRLAASIPPDVLAQFRDITLKALDLGLAANPNAKGDELLQAVKDLDDRLTKVETATGGGSLVPPAQG